LEEAKIIYLMNLPLTDAGNANRLHSLLGDDWKFVPQLGRWLHWNGQRWQEETDGSIRVAAMEAFRDLAATPSPPAICTRILLSFTLPSN
jgi:putative DNA primase/helicase